MSEISNIQKDIDNCRDAVLMAMAQCHDRAEIGKESAKKVITFQNELLFYKKKQEDIREVINYIVREYKNIEQYLIDKKELSMDMLRTAIEKVGLIVPDADVSGITLKVGDKTATVVNGQGQDINLREGSAFRSIMGILMRYTLLKSQPDAIQMVLLDESLSTLSDATASTMREYLDILKEDMLIVGIEQRNYLYDGIEKTVYEVIKEADNYSSVRRV